MGKEVSKETKEYSEVKCIIQYMLKIPTFSTPRFILLVLLKAKYNGFASFYKVYIYTSVLSCKYDLFLEV